MAADIEELRNMYIENYLITYLLVGQVAQSV